MYSAVVSKTLDRRQLEQWRAMARMPVRPSVTAGDSTNK